MPAIVVEKIQHQSRFPTDKQLFTLSLFLSFSFFIHGQQQPIVGNLIFTAEIKGCPKDDHNILFTTIKCMNRTRAVLLKSIEYFFLDNILFCAYIM